MPTLNKWKMYEDDELLVDLRNYDVGFSGDLWQTFTIFLESLANISSIWCLVGPDVNKKNTDFRDAVSVTEPLAKHRFSVQLWIRITAWGTPV